MQQRTSDHIREAFLSAAQDLKNASGSSEQARALGRLRAEQNEIDSRIEARQAGWGEEVPDDLLGIFVQAGRKYSDRKSDGFLREAARLATEQLASTKSGSASDFYSQARKQ